MALHHALKLLDPKARAALCFFMQGTGTLMQRQIDILEDEYSQLPNKTTSEAKILKNNIEACSASIDELGLSSVNVDAVEKYAAEFAFQGDHDVFVETVKALESWWRSPETIKAIGRQQKILQTYYLTAIQLAQNLELPVLRAVTEPYIIFYNYSFTVVLVAMMLQESPSTAAFDEGVIDPTWHPLDVGRIPYPLFEEAKIRKAIEDLTEGERHYLRAIFADFKSTMVNKAMTVNSMVEELHENYTHPLAVAFETVYRVFDDVLLNKSEANSGRLMGSLMNEESMPDIILDLRVRMAFAEPTPFMHPLTAPLKVLATVMDLLLDREGKSVAAFLMLGLFHLAATEEDIRAHFTAPAVVANVFDVLTKKIPPEILVPTMLTIELLWPLLDDIFSEEGREALKKRSEGLYLELCPIFKNRPHLDNVSEIAEAFARCAADFREMNPELMPELDDKKSVRQMLLKLPEYIKYIQPFPADGPEEASPADLYFGILLVWAFSTNTLPPLIRKGYLTVPEGLDDSLDLFFRLVFQVTKEEGGNKLMSGTEFEKKVEDYLSEHETDGASLKKKEDDRKQKTTSTEELTDEVPEGTIFN